MIFESHAHYDDEAFEEDRESLLEQIGRSGISHVINVGASIQTTERSIALAERYPFVYAAAGVHPDETRELNEEKLRWLRQQCGREKAVAVGEIGLEYYWDAATRGVQKKWCWAQLEMAAETGLPVIIHSREAAQDTLDMMRKFAQTHGARGVIHCFSYSKEIAQEYVRMGYLIGVGGVVTFKNGRKLKETVEAVPLESILLETDCPYLAPVPYRGKRNCSLYLPYVAEEIARIKGCTPQEVEEATWRNAVRLFFERRG